MYLICFGTRPELIKLIPLINSFKYNNIAFKTLFSGQHENLIELFYKYIDTPSYILHDIMTHGQTLNSLSSKILNKMDEIISSDSFKYIIVQGDTTTAYTIALSGFHRNISVIHLEAGLRTHNKFSPFPEEINRRLISQISDIHLCPTTLSVENLKNEGIVNNVFLAGNTIVDIYKHINKTTTPSKYINHIINTIPNYIVVTLHRRENRGKNIDKMWIQLNKLSESYNFIYIKHPSLQHCVNILNDKIKLLEPLCYEDMVHLISNCNGIITDSGGLQEEAVCANKKVLVCRDTTERPETIECGLGRLIHTNITQNINFFNEYNNDNIYNPYGNNVCEKIADILNNI